MRGLTGDRPDVPDVIAGVVEDVWRREAPHVLAALLRRGGGVEDCEDAAQDALLAASQQWQRGVLPDNPRGWLIRVASRRLVDTQRSEAARTRRELTEEQGRTATVVDHARDRDDSLELILLCCHPALTPASAVALTLRAVGGLTTKQVAAGLLVPESTAAQRISRAKARLAGIAAPFGASPPEELPARLHAARHVLHLVFTTGSSVPAGPELLDRGLTAEAIRLTERVHRALPQDAETTGLLALMLLTDARAATRVLDGVLVPLADQDRSTWDHGQIDRGVRLLEAALPHGPVGPFQLQAAIAAVHATAPTFADTDWVQVLELYRMLRAVAPSPAADLGSAIALSEVDGPAAGLAALEPLARARPRDHRVLAARAHLLEASGDAGAAEAYRQAAVRSDSVPEQHYLHARARRIEGPPPGP